jgi:hypothetical protein
MLGGRLLMPVGVDIAPVAARRGRGRRVRRLSIATALAGAAALIAGVVFAVTTTITLTGTGTASIGNVSLGTSASTSCPFSSASLAPGTVLQGSQTCPFTVNYTGNLPAYVSVTVQVQSRAGSGGTPLFDGTSSGLQLSVSDGQTSYATPSMPGTQSCAPSIAGYTTCWVESFDLAASSYTPNTLPPPSMIPDLTFGPGHATSVTLRVGASLPASTSNAYQGGSAVVTLTAQAVQAGANTLPTACNENTVGQPCPNNAGGSQFTWS